MAEPLAIDFEHAPLPVIGLDELIRNKRAAGRPKDLADVAALEALRRPTSSKRRALKARPTQTKSAVKSAVKHTATLGKPRTKRRSKK